jgi:hypothetical protein
MAGPSLVALTKKEKAELSISLAYPEQRRGLFLNLRQEELDCI